MVLRLMEKPIISNYRYDFFSVWANGIPYIDKILTILRQEPNIEIITIQRHSIENFDKFILALYACDTVPISHLKSKLEYLFDLPPTIIFIFVKNHNPQEIISGYGAFRKPQCKYIVSIKNRIRNQYNPKHIDPDFQILPLAKGVSHEHVIHASDHESQVDYTLRLLGFKEGISFIEGDSVGLPFKKPFHIPRPKTYSYRRLSISSLKANILYSMPDYPLVLKKSVSIVETPHYLGLIEDKNLYIDYLNQFRFDYLHDDYSLEKLLMMDLLTREGKDDFPPILVRQTDDNNIFTICDGVHRAAVKLHSGETKINAVVLK